MRHYVELQEQFRSFQQLMLNKQREAGVFSVLEISKSKIVMDSMSIAQFSGEYVRCFEGIIIGTSSSSKIKTDSGDKTLDPVACYK